VGVATIGRSFHYRSGDSQVPIRRRNKALDQKRRYDCRKK